MNRYSTVDDMATALTSACCECDGRGCVVCIAADKLREQQALLRSVEWSGWLQSCPVCKWSLTNGHEEGCALAVVLAQEEPHG